jgi:DNA-directed RNA polymerase specialized sigma24 family protein
VATCRYPLELSETETATVLALPRGTVKSRLSRALRRLHGAPDLVGYLPEEAAERD